MLLFVYLNLNLFFSEVSISIGIIANIVGINISKIAIKSMVDNINRGVLKPKVQINIRTGSNISRAYLYSQ